MKKIYAISGSASDDSSNRRLLVALAEKLYNYTVTLDKLLTQLPLYTPEKDQGTIPKKVKTFRENIQNVDIVIISTPEYLHNIPAVLKNGLEWLKTSGEFYNKRLVLISYTPHPPRGIDAMQSAVKSLKALNANILLEMPLYQVDLIQRDGKLKIPNEILEVLTVSLEF